MERDDRPSELQILAASVRAITRRPVEHDDVFTATNTSFYGSLVLGLVLATAFELVAIHFLISSFIDSYQWAFHVGIVVVHLYGIAWLLGDFRLMRERGFELTNDTLRIRLGARWNADVPLALIQSVELGEVPELDRLAGEKLPDGTVAITPWDTPNLTLRLAEPVTVYTYFGLSKQASVLQLRLDEASKLSGALSECLGG